MGTWEMVVQGKVTPDAYLIFKPTLNQGFPAIIKRVLVPKENKMIYNSSDENPTKEVEVSEKDRNIFVLNDEEILTLAKWGLEIEKHYTERAGKAMPMDMEWAKDGITNELFIVQARPENQFSQKKSIIACTGILFLPKQTCCCRYCRRDENSKW